MYFCSLFFPPLLNLIHVAFILPFLLSCSSQFSFHPVLSSTDLNHILLCCDPWCILPVAELFLSSRGWNSCVSLPLSGSTLWPRKVMYSGLHMGENLTDQQLSFTAGLLSISKSQDKAQEQGEKAKQKREGYKRVEEENKGQREEMSLIPTLLQPLLLVASQ